LAGNPSVLLADEPTGSLDFRTGEMIMDLLDDLHRSRRLTSIHVTHNLNFAHRADRVVALERGQLVAASQLLESVALGNPSNSIEGNHHV
jgi:ABC-type lipoprotein export system ATPase subunit